MAAGRLIDGSGPLAGRKLMALEASQYGLNSAAPGLSFVDIFGPWR
jgi:hypothetical protein